MCLHEHIPEVAQLGFQDPAEYIYLYTSTYLYLHIDLHVRILSTFTYIKTDF